MALMPDDYLMSGTEPGIPALFRVWLEPGAPPSGGEVDVPDGKGLQAKGLA